MPKYRKKPIVFEAFQMTPERRNNRERWPEWLRAAWGLRVSDMGAVFPPGLDAYMLAIRTLEGIVLIDWGDYIVRGAEGEIYPCKPDLFEATYEAVEGDG